MKRIFLTLFAAGLFSAMYAQSVDKVKDLLKTNKLTEAKTEVDALIATPKGQKSAEAWYQKVKVYNALAVSDQKATYPDALGQSLEALKKYAELDDKKLVSLTVDGYKPVNEIYQGLFKVGADNYNASKYPEALYDFTTALDAIKFMNAKGWIKQNMDTTSTLYAGISAEKSNKRDTAAIYYKTIVDSGITKINGNSMEEIYKWVADYYDKKNDRPNADKYIAIGKAKFPGDLFYDELDLDRLRKASGQKDSLWAKYEKINAEFPDSAIYFFNYGLELYQYSSDTTKGPLPANSAELIQRAQEKMGKSLALNPNYPQANLVMGQIYYNQGIEIQAKTKTVKGKTPDDIKQRAGFRTQAMAMFDKAIPYFEKVDQLLGKEAKLRMAEKSALKDSYDLLVTIYEQKRDQPKIASWTDKYNNVDKIH